MRHFACLRFTPPRVLAGIKACPFFEMISLTNNVDGPRKSLIFNCPSPPRASLIQQHFGFRLAFSVLFAFLALFSTLGRFPLDSYILFNSLRDEHLPLFQLATTSIPASKSIPTVTSQHEIRRPFTVYCSWHLSLCRRLGRRGAS
jgi:hypothetical protein